MATMLTFENANTEKDQMLAIIGSREFSDYQRLCYEVDLIRNHHKNIKKIISGGAIGADKLGEKYASERKIPFSAILPEWKTHGRVAGLLRNQDIIDQSDIVVAFWNGKSPGTRDSIQKAQQGKKLLYVMRF